MEVLDAVRERERVWETESVCATLVILALCVRTAQTDITEKRALITRSRPAQVIVSSMFDFTVNETKNCMTMTVICLTRVVCRVCVLVACYHACKKCTGPQDYKCLDCKPGWILHDNKCVGKFKKVICRVS